MAARFYVYELIDPRDGLVFYVGKGCGGRLRQHTKQALKGEVGPKCDRIREMIVAGQNPVERIVRHFESEAAAYEFECEHIASFGLENLTNIHPGGGAVKSAERLAEDRDAMWLKLWPKVKRVLSARHLGWSFSLGSLDITVAVDALIATFLREISDKAFNQLIEGERHGRSPA